MGSCYSSVEVESEAYINTGGMNSMSLKASQCKGLEKRGRFSTTSIITSGDKINLRVSSSTKSSSSDALLRKKNSRHNVLLLGTSGAGKSTLLKHLRVMYKKGHFQEEKLMYKKTIRSLLVQSLKQLIDLVVEKSNQEHSSLSEYIQIRINRVKDIQQPEELTVDEQEAIDTLCTTRSFLDVVEEQAKQFTPTSLYFINGAARVTRPEWIPAEQDILMVGQPTHGACVMELKARKDRLRVVDLGGQRKERRKWPHFFEGVTAIVFCVSLADYDEYLEEDPTVNRMKEALQLFGDIVKNEALKDATIVIYFNKKDLFREKIKKTNITTAFPEYKGAQDYDDAIDYIHQQFLKLSKHSCMNKDVEEGSSDEEEGEPKPSRPIFCHTTCAVSFTDMQKKWASTVHSLYVRPKMRAISF